MTTTNRKARQGKLRTTGRRVEVEMHHLRSNDYDDTDVASIDAPNVTMRVFDPQGETYYGDPRRVFGAVSLHHGVEVEVRPTRVDNGTQIDVVCDNGGYHGRVRYGITLFDLPLDVLAAAVAAAIEAQAVQS